jgi:hypothetical protein
MTTTAFTAGSITLSDWVQLATSTNPHPTNSFVFNVSSPTFVFNWTANTNISGQPAGTGSPQVITAADGSSGDNASLQIVNTDANLTIENGSGGTLLAGAGTYTVGGVGGEGVAQLQSDIQGLQLFDATNLDEFVLKFTLADTTTPASTVFYEDFTAFNPCYTPGTRITTPAGEVPVEDFQIGDLVTTASGIAKPIKWIGRRTHTADQVEAHPNLRPVLIRKGALGDALPHRDLIVSPMHAMFVDEVLIPAVALVNGISILRRETSGMLEYIHIELEEHDIVLAEGAPAETFLDDGDRSMFANASEYYDLYDLDEPKRSFCAPRIEEGYRLEAIRCRLAARAGALPTCAVVPGELAGHVERFEGGVLEGWVMDRADPTSPVELEVLVGGEIALTVLANRYRTDLDGAGLAGGRCGFTVELPAVTPLEQIEVRRAADACPLPMPVAAFADA